MGEGVVVQDSQGSNGSAFPDGVPFEPLYFMAGFIAGLLFINLFKGRWFL